VADPSARKPADRVLEAALRAALEEIAARRELERAERRAKMRVVSGGRRNAA